MSARRCNECTLCCKLLPVAEIGKLAGVRCREQRAKGCRVYGTAAFPLGCSLWSCLWLSDESLQVPRPDRAGYVLDPTPEFVTIEGMTASVVQIWIDPCRPLAHRDPALRAWLAQRWETHQQLALVRYDAWHAITLLPPALTGIGWLEQAGRASTEHSAGQIAATLQALRDDG